MRTGSSSVRPRWVRTAVTGAGDNGAVTRVLSYRVVALPFVALAILAYASLFNVRDWPWPVRAALLVVWMVATIQVLRLAFLRDRRIDRATEQYERQRSRALRVAREHVIRALLSDRTGGVLPPEGHGTVFLLEGDVLRPFWPPSQSDSEHQVRSFGSATARSGWPCSRTPRW